MTKTELMQLRQSELVEMVLAKQGEVDALSAHVTQLQSKIEDYHDENIAAEDALNDLGCMIRHLPTAILAERDGEVAKLAWDEALYTYARLRGIPILEDELAIAKAQYAERVKRGEA